MENTFKITGAYTEIDFLYQIGVIRSFKHISDNTYEITVRYAEDTSPCSANTAQKLHKWAIATNKIEKEYATEWSTCFEASEFVTRSTQAF